MPKAKIDLTVTGNEEDLHAFLRVCRWIQHCGETGANQAKRIIVDGDGSANLKFSVNGEQLSGPVDEQDRMWIGE